MSLLPRVRALFRTLLHRDVREAELDEELEAYLAELVAEHRRRGLGEAEARRAARRELGAVDDVKESVRASWSGEWVHTLVRDVRYSVRALRTRPTFTLVAVLTLALGLGGATAVFSALNGVFFQPPPGIYDASRIAAIDRWVDGEARDGLSYPDYEHVRATTRRFTDVASHVGTPLRLGFEDGSRRNIVVDFTTGNYFALLGVQPALGRVFGEGEAEFGDPRTVVVLSDRFWRSQLGADPAIVGRALDLGDARFTVIGIAPPGFEGTMTGQHVDAWTPLPNLVATGYTEPGFHLNPSLRIFSTFGRLSGGVSTTEARAELGADTMSVRSSFGRYPEFRGQDVPFFRLLGGAVGLLLLLACANVATLFLLRASARRQEMAARLALGAPRAAIARQLLVEGGLIAGAACLLGGIGAHLFVNRSATLAAQFGSIAFGLDGRVLAFAGGIATVTTLLVAVLPIVRIGRVQPMSALRNATAGGLRGVSGTQRALVVFQVAVSLTLVATASTIHGNLKRLLAEDPGFDPTNVAAVYFDPRRDGWSAERTRHVLRALPEAARANPEVESAVVSNMAPLLGRSRTGAVYRDGEAPADPSDASPDATPPVGAIRPRVVSVGPGYFETLGIPLLAGRELLPADVSGAPVAVVSARLARALWSDDRATGRYLELSVDGAPTQRAQVLGVAARHKHASLTDDDPLTVYVPIEQSPPDAVLLVLRGRAATPSRELMTGIVAEVDPEIFPEAFWTMDELMSGWVSLDRRVSTWIGVSGVLALFLAALGVYGVVAHVARERVRELAVRSALGALPRQLVVKLMGMGIRLSLAGGAAGMLLLYGTQPVVRRSLESASGPSLSVVAGCAGALLLTMAFASFVPARRVARIAPVVVLRQE